MTSTTLPQTLILNARLKQLIAIDQILYLEGDINYTSFHFQSQRRTIIAHPLKHFEADLLPHGFIRIHRSHIINSRCVKSANLLDNSLTLVDRTVLRVARRRVKTLLNNHN